MDCIFCKIINGVIPSKKIYEDDYFLAFLDINPCVDGHTLLIPKKHYADFSELPDDLLLELNNVRKKLTTLLMEKLNVKALSFSVNYGDSQEVKHYHMHLLPNYHIYNTTKKTTDEIYELITK